MSLDEYRRRVLLKIDEQKDETLTQLANVRHRQASSNASDFTPASTCEEIALRHVELSTRVLALDVARNIVIKEFQALTSPAQKPTDDGAKPKEREAVY